ncbi:MAG: hypothetical protein MUE34_02150 [Acidimicrobiales bacterium]|jgi:hypothetical protein|nr:hypothetical protein [Acidimicrobiales bacterium]
MRPPAHRLSLLVPVVLLGLLAPTACADDEVDDLGDEPGVDGRLDEPNTSVGDDGYHEVPDDVPEQAPATPGGSVSTTSEAGTAGTAANPGDPDTPGAGAGGGGATGEGP